MLDYLLHKSYSSEGKVGGHDSSTANHGAQVRILRRFHINGILKVHNSILSGLLSGTI
jgi:hypothetical protein